MGQPYRTKRVAPAECTSASMRHQRVDAAPAVDGGARQGSAGCVAGDVALHRDGVGAGSTAGVHHLFGAFGAAVVVDQHLVPALRQHQGRGGAGDNGDTPWGGGRVAHFGPSVSKPSRNSRFISLPLALRGNGVVVTVQLSGRL